MNEIIASLRELASRARRLPPPSHRDPEAFHIGRSELAHDIERVADLLNGDRRDERWWKDREWEAIR